MDELKERCAKDWLEQFESVFPKDRDGHPELNSDLSKVDTKLFIHKLMFLNFYTYLNELASENSRLKSEAVSRVTVTAVEKTCVCKCTCIAIQYPDWEDRQKKVSDDCILSSVIKDDLAGVEEKTKEVFQPERIPESERNSQTPTKNMREPLSPILNRSTDLISYSQSNRSLLSSPLSPYSSPSLMDLKPRPAISTHLQSKSPPLVANCKPQDSEFSFLISPISRVSNENENPVILTQQHASSPVNDYRVRSSTPEPDRKLKSKKNAKTSSPARQYGSLNDSTDSVQLICTAPQKNLSAVPGKSKEGWIKPRTPPNGRKDILEKGQGKRIKRMRQVTLLSMSKNFPKHIETVDVSTLKEFQGGSVANILNKSTSQNTYPAKRKSDEMEDFCLERRKNSVGFADLDETVFDDQPVILPQPVSCIPTDPDVDIFENSPTLEASSRNNKKLAKDPGRKCKKEKVSAYISVPKITSEPETTAIQKPSSNKCPRKCSRSDDTEDKERTKQTKSSAPFRKPETKSSSPVRKPETKSSSPVRNPETKSASPFRKPETKSSSPFRKPEKSSSPFRKPAAKSILLSPVQKPVISLKPRKVNLNFTEELIEDFNKLPERTIEPTYGKAVRKKSERSKLSGLPCDQCRHYFQGLESQMSDAEIQRVINDCSKHREHPDQVKNFNMTPTDFWSTDMPSTQEAYAKGILKVGVASPSRPKRRYNLLVDTDEN